MAPPISISPPCSVCVQDDKMVHQQPVTTNFGGIVETWVCRRCGVVAIQTFGDRPGGGNGNMSIRVGQALALYRDPFR